MQFRLLATTALPLQQQLQWVLPSALSGGFIVGDERKAFGISVANPSAPIALEAARAFDSSTGGHHPCNLPIPDAHYAEFIRQPWHGFRFLESAAYNNAKGKDGKPVGDLLRMLVFGPDYGHYVSHPANGMILALRSGSMELLKRTDAGFESLDQTRARGKAVLAFAAHPTEPLVAYGDNAGTFHAHRFDDGKFGKATKIAARERKASRVEFVAGGTMVVVGGMGYLATYSYVGGKFAPGHQVSVAVRDFIWADDGKLVLVNHGLNGISAYAYGEGGFSKLAEVKVSGGANQIALSADMKHLASTGQEGPGLSVYAIP